MSDRTSYTYSPLSSGQIRLLRIIQSGEDVHCALTNVQLDECPAYEAVSYCWGEGDATSQVFCDEAALKITQHLHQGLQDFFALVGSGWLWIDAICINQADNEEKATQVPLMYNIYTAAAKVLIWLGPAQDDSDLAIGIMPELTSTLSKLDTRAVKRTNLSSFGLPSQEESIWSALEKFFSRPWYFRLWVIQEIALAKSLYLVCGAKTLQWNQIMETTVALRAQPGITSSRELWNDTMDKIGNIDQVRKNLKDGYVPAALLVNLSRQSKTREPLDRVYGILGLFAEETRGRIDVDYSIENKSEYWRTYSQLFRVLIPDEGPRVFAALSSTNRHPKLPSWCPDLMSLPSTVMIPHHGLSSGGGVGLREKGISPIEASTTSDEMHIPGLAVDTVVSVVELTGHENWDKTAGTLVKYYKEVGRNDVQCCELIEKMRPEFDITTAQYARTLVANHDRVRERKFTHELLEEEFDMTLKDYRASLLWSGDAEARAWFRNNPPPKAVLSYKISLGVILPGRNFFTTEKGRIGIGPRATRPGDHVCIIFSGYCPYILRSEPGGATHRIIGDSYVDDLMAGEVFQLHDIVKDGYETFRVV